MNMDKDTMLCLMIGSLIGMVIGTYTFHKLQDYERKSLMKNDLWQLNHLNDLFKGSHRSI